MGLPPLNSGKSEGLGSLAQSARSKKLNQARGLLIGVGILFLVVSIINLFTIRYQVREMIKREQAKLAPGMFIRPDAEEYLVRLNTLLFSGYIAVSVLFIVFGFLVKKIPVVATVVPLVVFIGMVAIAFVASRDPMVFLQGWWIKLLVVVGLIQAIQAAIAYQKEQAALMNLEPEYE